MSGVTEPLVSIVTPVYNAENFVLDTINSVLSQKYNNWELIFVDDFSDDDSVNIIINAQKKDERIKLLQLKRNSGAAIARNEGVKLANGRYLAFLDADDTWFESKINEQVNFMKSMDAAFTFTGYEFSDADNVKTNVFVGAPSVVDTKDQLVNNIIWTSTVMIDLDKVNKDLIVMPNINYGEDMNLWLKVISLTGFAYGINKTLAVYRRSSRSLSSNKLKIIFRKMKLYASFKEVPLYLRMYYFFFATVNALKKRIG